jgi:hypothetical protein
MIEIPLLGDPVWRRRPHDHINDGDVGQMRSLALGDRLSSVANRRQWVRAIYGTDLGLDGPGHAMVILHLLHEVHRRHWLAEAYGFGRRTPLSASWMEIAGLDEIRLHSHVVYRLVSEGAWRSIVACCHYGTHLGEVR